MKKFLLICLFIPLTLFARPEKKFFKHGQVGQLVGVVKWGVLPASCSWIWSNTGETYVGQNDDDCDDSARTCYGEYNSTDCTCTDGAAGGCDGVYPRIRFSKLKKGFYKVFMTTEAYVYNTNSYGGWAWYDGTDISGTSFCYNNQSDDTGCHAPIGHFYYAQDQGETVFEIYFAETNTTTGALGRFLNWHVSPYQWSIFVYYLPIDTDTKEINFK